MFNSTHLLTKKVFITLATSQVEAEANVMKLQKQ